MVQRYIEIPEAEVATCMHEHSAGDYVKYEDYVALKKEHQKLLDAVIQYGHDPETLMELFKV